MLKNARFVKYPDDPDAPLILIRKLTPEEKDALLEQLMERMNGDTLSDLMYEIATEATKGQADSIIWD